jgi:hypothetical protein
MPFSKNLISSLGCNYLQEERYDQTKNSQNVRVAFCRFRRVDWVVHVFNRRKKGNPTKQKALTAH